MANGVIKTFSEFKKLTEEERSFYIYEQVGSLKKKFASKWVEKAVLGVIVMILIAFFREQIANVIK